MSEVDLFTKVAQTLAGPVGTFFLIVLLGYAIATRKLVPGWIYDQLDASFKKCTTELDGRITKNETDLDQLRRERIGKSG